MNLGLDDAKCQRLMGPLNRMYGHLRAERQGTLGCWLEPPLRPVFRGVYFLVPGGTFPSLPYNWPLQIRARPSIRKY